MFKDIKLKPVYDSYSNNIVREFYNPILKNSIRFDRVSAYFSAKSLALYSNGLEYFCSKNGKYRLIISEQISKYDYEQIKRGYKLKESLYKNMAQNLRQTLTLEEEKNISNLAYLISIGIVDIKIAFTTKGIFHDKFGLFYDESGNVIYFRGSNNETYQAVMNNYESFEVTCNWLCSDFDYRKIEHNINQFQRLWNNQHKKILVLECEEVIKKEILKFNKGEIVKNTIFLEKNSVILDYEDKKLILYNHLEDKRLITGGFLFRTYLKKYVDYCKEEKMFFKVELGYKEYKSIIKHISNFAEKKNFKLMLTKNLEIYMQNKEMYLDERFKVGLEIKKQDSKYKEKLYTYKDILEKTMSRQLRDKQLWDSFFMCTMKKCSNFSVPGSGKTTSVLGVYAYLKYIKKIDSIVVISPKNAFDTWKEEFKICFKGKEELSYFDIHDNRYKSREEKINALKYDTGNTNLFLFNYESIGSYKDVLRKIINHRVLLVYDEVHRIKKINGERANIAIDIAKNANHIITMTGTPIPNSYQDIYNNLNILYNDQYSEFFSFSINELKNPSYRDIKNINDKIQPFFCRTTKQQLEVPEANEDKIYEINCTSAENQLFNILYSAYKDNIFLMLIRILQLESNPRMLLKKIEEDDFKRVFDLDFYNQDVNIVDYSDDVIDLINKIDCSSKTLECIDLVRKIVKQNKTVVVWCIFIDSIKNLTNKLRKMNLSVEYIIGETEENERDRIIQDFKSNRFNVLITNPHTLGESVSLHKVCHDAVYFEWSYNLVHLLQSKDRIHRLGLKKSDYTQYYFLQMMFDYKGKEISLDKKIYNRLCEKETIMLDAIENDVLETPTTTEEELELIFKDLI